MHFAAIRSAMVSAWWEQPPDIIFDPPAREGELGGEPPTGSTIGDISLGSPPDVLGRFSGVTLPLAQFSDVPT